VFAHCLFTLDPNAGNLQFTCISNLNANIGITGVEIHAGDQYTNTLSALVPSLNVTTNSVATSPNSLEFTGGLSITNTSQLNQLEQAVYAQAAYLLVRVNQAPYTNGAMRGQIQVFTVYGVDSVYTATLTDYKFPQPSNYSGQLVVVAYTAATSTLSWSIATTDPNPLPYTIRQFDIYGNNNLIAYLGSSPVGANKVVPVLVFSALAAGQAYLQIDEAISGVLTLSSSNGNFLNVPGFVGSSSIL